MCANEHIGPSRIHSTHELLQLPSALSLTPQSTLGDERHRALAHAPLSVI